MLNTTTSRRLFMTAAVAGGFLGKAQEQQEGEWGTHERDTWIRLIDDERGGFLVGVRTSVKADLALVAVFYDLDYPAAVGGKLLLSKESVAPIVGLGGYGGTRQSFSGIPRDKVKHVDVTFLNVVSARKLTHWPTPHTIPR